MIPTTLPEKTVTYIKPEGWTDEQCGDLEVRVGNVEIDDAGNSAVACTSVWEMSDAEFELFKEYRKVYVTIFVARQPVVSVGVQQPIYKP